MDSKFSGLRNHDFLGSSAHPCLLSLALLSSSMCLHETVHPSTFYRKFLCSQHLFCILDFQSTTTLWAPVPPLELVVLQCLCCVWPSLALFLFICFWTCSCMGYTALIPVCLHPTWFGSGWSFCLCSWLDCCILAVDCACSCNVCLTSFFSAWYVDWAVLSRF